MANSKKSGVDKPNTVELIPTLGSWDEWGPSYYEREGWTLEEVNVRGQGGMEEKREHYNERTLTVKLKGKRTLDLEVKDRQYSLFRSVTIKGEDFVAFRDWANENLPFFSCSISSVVVTHKETGTRVSIMKIGRTNKNPLSKKFIAHMINGRKMTTADAYHLCDLFGERLVYALCSYDYSSGKRNVICDA
jgi:hypothetical protein